MLCANAFDKEGFLCDLNDWNPDVAAQIAASENLQLSSAHWEVISLLRDYYREYDSSCHAGTGKILRVKSWGGKGEKYIPDVLVPRIAGQAWQ